MKSRIAKLKEVIEDSHGDVMETYDLQQAYDVADMLKQYFRDLPDTLLTAKMSDTFIAIFQRKTKTFIVLIFFFSHLTSVFFNRYRFAS